MSLDGFLIDVHTVSESNLNIEIDASSIDWDTYKNLIINLEDLLSDIDEEHSVKSWLVRGRGLQAKHRRVSAQDRRRKLVFSPFPSKFQNLLKNTRTYLYALVADNCLVLEKIGRRNVYLLPKHLAPFFIEAVERINQETLDPLRKDIDDFQNSGDYQGIQQCLFNNQIDPTVLKTATFHLGNFRVDVIPVDFNYNVNMDDVYNKMNRTKASKGLDQLRKQIERRTQTFTINAVSDLVSRILELASGFDGDRKIKGAVKKVEKLMEICKSLGFTDVNTKVLEPLKQIFQARKVKRQELVNKYFGTSNLKEGVEKHLPSFLEE